MERAGVCEGVKNMTDRERESKFQQKEGEQRKAGQETREEMKEEAQEKVQKENGSLLKKLRWRKENFLVILLLGVLLFVTVWPVEKNSRSAGTKNSSTTDSPLTFPDYGESTEDTRATYVVSLEHSLEELLSTMEGVGDNKVMITLKPSTRNSCFSSASTMEIEGVVVCAKGAANGKVAKNISEVIQALFGLEAHKIKIAKMI